MKLHNMRLNAIPKAHFIHFAHIFSTFLFLTLTFLKLEHTRVLESFIGILSTVYSSNTRKRKLKGAHQRKCYNEEIITKILYGHIKTDHRLTIWLYSKTYL